MGLALDIKPTSNVYVPDLGFPVYALEDIEKASTDVVRLGGVQPRPPAGVLAAYRYRNGIVVFAAFRYVAGPFSDGTGPVLYEELFHGEGQSHLTARAVRIITFGEDGALEHVNLGILRDAFNALRRWFD